MPKLLAEVISQGIEIVSGEGFPGEPMYVVTKKDDVLGRFLKLSEAVKYVEEL